MLDSHDVSHTIGKSGGARTPQPGEYVVHERPELLATRPNELWSWGISKLKGPAKWSYFLSLCDSGRIQPVCGGLDGGALGECGACQKAHLGNDPKIGSRSKLAYHICQSWIIDEVQVCGDAIKRSGDHQDAFSSHTSNDNPFSESQFKTIKYRPDFPKGFSCIEYARGFCVVFFDWYNTKHHHSSTYPGNGFLRLGRIGQPGKAGDSPASLPTTASGAARAKASRATKTCPTPYGLTHRRPRVEQ